MSAESREVLDPGGPGHWWIGRFIRSGLDERRGDYVRIDHPNLPQNSVLRPEGMEGRDTDANMIVLSPCRQTIRLTREGFVLQRARLLEEDGLKVTSRDGFTVMPAYFERPDTHWRT